MYSAQHVVSYIIPTQLELSVYFHYSKPLYAYLKFTTFTNIKSLHFTHTILNYFLLSYNS
jgi:hypothetical protein